MSVWNVFLASTNIAALWPIYYMNKNNYTTCFLICGAACSSFMSHLLQSHKHNMVGFGTPKELSRVLSMVDISFAVNLALHLFLRMSWNLVEEFAPWLIVSFACNLISERASLSKPMFVLFHSMWHISIFFLLGQILQRV